MALSDLTIASIEAAIAEFDTFGRDVFLARYGFGQAHGYFVAVGSRLYDSKAIVGAAHGHISPLHRPLRSSEFSGGDKAVADVLRRLGFDIINRTDDKNGPAEPSSRNPPWLRDELILALELYLSDRASPPGKASRPVADLSAVLNRLNAALGRAGNIDFRNPKAST